MTQFSMAVMALQRNSKFAQAYADGLHKSKYWDPVYEDSLDLIAKLPELCARIYNHTYHNDRAIPYDKVRPHCRRYRIAWRGGALPV